MKSRKGITLIALVITIIVLLILAGITINLTIGEHGILIMAKQAGKNYQNAAEYEQGAIGNFFNEAQNIIAGGNGNGTGTNPGGNDKPETKIELSELKVGDTIKYDTGVESKGKNGVISCKVLYPIESEYGLQLVTTTDYSTASFGGTTWEQARDNWNNHVEVANRGTAAYINTDYVYDARCVGTDPTVSNGMFINKNDDGGRAEELNSSWTLPSGWTSRNTGLVIYGESYKKDMEQLKKMGIKWDLCCRAGAVGVYGKVKYMTNIRNSDGSMTIPISIAADGTLDYINQIYQNNYRICFSVKSEGIYAKVDAEDGTFILSK